MSRYIVGEMPQGLMRSYKLGRLGVVERFQPIDGYKH